MVINFECKKCLREFDCEVGKITFAIGDVRPTFGKSIVCRQCGDLTMDEVWLSEVGQGQMTEATMGA